MKQGLLFISLLFISLSLFGQERAAGSVLINGNLYKYLIDECGDTLIVADLENVSISSLRSFGDPDEFRRYRRYRQYAAKVYPYAVEAIRIFRELEASTEEMNNRQRRKHIKRLQKELKEEFEDPLKRLTRTQGMILIKMIEKELDTPMYFLIRDLRNGLTASYWNNASRLYGYDLKEGYIPKADPILDAVLNDLDISYKRQPETDQ